MAADTATLKAGIIAMFNVLKTYDGTTGKTRDDAIEYEATQLTALINNFVKSGSVNVPVAVDSSVGFQTGGTTVHSTGTSTGTWS